MEITCPYEDPFKVNRHHLKLYATREYLGFVEEMKIKLSEVKEAEP